MVQLGSIGGALFAFVIADRIGRIWATRVLCTLWIVGISMFMGNNGSLGLVYAGRLIAGLVRIFDCFLPLSKTCRATSGTAVVTSPLTPRTGRWANTRCWTRLYRRDSTGPDPRPMYLHIHGFCVHWHRPRLLRQLWMSSQHRRYNARPVAGSHLATYHVLWHHLYLDLPSGRIATFSDQKGERCRSAQRHGTPSTIAR